MLKVNTNKISREEFMKKYGFHSDGLGGIKTTETSDWFLLVNALDFNKCHIDWCVHNDCATSSDIGMLFDMISSGDVIKEEGK